ncbi:MAG: hypothetical protein EKK54_10135 [Neisseriaceae bacterium]|nr:MAG: hypothetical protein EKK54_10135 [Neisseriaceae bacterium]
MKKNLLLMSLVTGMIAACNSGSSSNNNAAPATPIQYSAIHGYNDESAPTLVTGIRGVNGSSYVYISGVYSSTTNSGLLYVGPISTNGGTWHLLNYPSSTGVTVTSTSLYGPNNGDTPGTVQIVGNYTTVESAGSAIGLLYQGAVDGSGTWSTLLPPSPDNSNVINTIAHSTMGGLVVGNYDTRLATGKAFIYDITKNTYTNLTKPGAVSITAYGIWYNGGTSYTIAGGYSDANARGITTGYLVDWDSATNTASHWTSFNYLNQPVNSIVSHFEGITTDGNGGYNLAADVALASGVAGAAFVNVPRNADGTFGTASWTNIAYPGASIISANTVYQNNILGVYIPTGSSSVYSYLATLP